MSFPLPDWSSLSECRAITVDENSIQIDFAAKPPFYDSYIKCVASLTTLVGIPQTKRVIIYSKKITSLRGIPKGVEYVAIMSRSIIPTGSPKGINEFGSLPSTVTNLGVLTLFPYTSVRQINLKPIRKAVYERFLRGLYGLRVILLKAFLKCRLFKNKELVVRMPRRALKRVLAQYPYQNTQILFENENEDMTLPNVSEKWAQPETLVLVDVSPDYLSSRGGLCFVSHKNRVVSPIFNSQNQLFKCCKQIGLKLGLDYFISPNVFKSMDDYKNYRKKRDEYFAKLLKSQLDWP